MQTICLISFDNWQYDKFIIQKLVDLGFNAYHIDLGGFKHASLWDRILNLFSKIILQKNLKKKKKQDYILNTLAKKGFHDQILVINPDVIDLNCHLQIKKYTSIYNAFLYDSVQRCPIKHLLKYNLFDTIYSFDESDCKQYEFEKSNNFIYFNKQKITENAKYKIVTVSSFDKRFPVFNAIAFQMQTLKIPFQFTFVSRNIIFKTLKYNLKVMLGLAVGKTINTNLKFQSKKITINSLLEHYKNTEIILDLVQQNQTGLSFRVFEALGMQKKLITDNQSVKNYDFYNPNSIFVLDKQNPEIPNWFLESKFEPILDAIYEKYTLDHWVRTIFKIK